MSTPLINQLWHLGNLEICTQSGQIQSILDHIRFLVYEKESSNNLRPIEKSKFFECSKNYDFDEFDFSNEHGPPQIAQVSAHDKDDYDFLNNNSETVKIDEIETIFQRVANSTNSKLEILVISLEILSQAVYIDFQNHKISEILKQNMKHNKNW